MSLRIALINPLLSSDCEMPLGLLHVAEAAERAGHRVEVLDTAFARSARHLWPALERFGPDVVGFTAMSVSWPLALDLAREAKRRTGARIVFGGPHATLFPEEVVGSGVVDAAVVGDAELSFPQLLEAIEAGRDPAVPGVCHRLGGRLRFDPRVPRVADLDTLPFVDRRRLRTIEAYVSAMGHAYLFGHRAVSIVASRGCPFDCSYCQPVLRRVHGKKVRVRSPENVVAEMEGLRRAHAIDAIWFSDDTFTFDPRWTRRLCELLVERGVGLRWSCNSRVDTVTREQVELMARAGCVQLRFGLESGSQLLLDRTMNKGISLAQTRAAFGWAREHGIKTWAYTMVGGFDETRETAAETLALIEELAPHHVQITMTTPLPGTHFAQELAGRPDVRVLPHGFGDLRLFERCLIDTPLLAHDEVERLHRAMYRKVPGSDPSRLSGAERLAWARRRLEFLRELRRLVALQPGFDGAGSPRRAAAALRAVVAALPPLDAPRLRLRRAVLGGLERARPLTRRLARPRRPAAGEA